MKKTSVSGLSGVKTKRRTPFDSWHNGGEIEILKYARSLRTAARTLIGNLNLGRSAGTGWDICPVVLLYRQALEIHLKMLVGEGSNFLPSPTDPISLSTTHSLRWLAQIVCQIVRKVGWESEFRCDGVSSPAEFSTLVNEVETFDPVARAIRSSRSPNLVSEYYRNFDIFKFATKLDSLLDLLDSTADALAATWDRCADATVGEGIGGGGFGPTIQ
ncbi:MAG: hypothetical protein ABSB15_09235 [Bryobacteraceae bacterium]